MVKFEIYNGTETQTADTDLISETDGVWTSSDKLQGVVCNHKVGIVPNIW